MAASQMIVRVAEPGVSLRGQVPAQGDHLITEEVEYDLLLNLETHGGILGEAHVTCPNRALDILWEMLAILQITV